MSEPKHTPGPWVWKNVDPHQNPMGRISVWRDGVKGHDIAWLPFDLNGTAHREANARLIAAAPELLGALKMLLHAWEPATVAEAKLRAEQAIAKAGGER